jgi:hypothetical protein
VFTIEKENRVLETRQCWAKAYATLAEACEIAETLASHHKTFVFYVIVDRKGSPVATFRGMP